MRELILVPIVHSLADMGSMSRGLEEISIQKLGKERWERNVIMIEKFWNEVELALDKLKLDYSKIRVYQDGLPCTREDLILKIINQTAEKGSRNYKIIKKLMERGAKIEGTESPELLLEEFNSIKAFAEAGSKEEKEKALKRFEKTKNELMEKRDEFIAKRIDTTLKSGETGILFIGAHHDVKQKLANDINLKSLD
ncbi:MAG: hypothetical protein ABIH55_01790 [Nanoarchaeota archaeon]